MGETSPLFVADEGFNRDIVRGLLSRNPDLSIVRVQEVGLNGASDPAILEWAAETGRIVLTHDENSMVGGAVALLSQGLAMPGVVVVHQNTPTRRAIDGLMELIGASLEGEWEHQIRFVSRR